MQVMIRGLVWLGKITKTRVYKLGTTREGGVEIYKF